MPEVNGNLINVPGRGRKNSISANAVNIEHFECDFHAPLPFVVDGAKTGPVTKLIELFFQYCVWWKHSKIKKKKNDPNSIRFARAEFPFIISKKKKYVGSDWSKPSVADCNFGHLICFTAHFRT